MRRGISSRVNQVADHRSELLGIAKDIARPKSEQRRQSKTELGADPDADTNDIFLEGTRVNPPTFMVRVMAI